MDRSSSGRSQKLRGKITAQTRSTNDLIAPISAATSKSAGIQILSNYAPECCISSESFPAPPDVPGITDLVAGNRFMEIYFNLSFRSMPGDRALPVLYYVVKTEPLTDPSEVISDVSGLGPPIRVTGLINGNSYRFTLYTVNALGLSNSGSTATAGGSSSLVGVPVDSPSPPIDISASPPSAPLLLRTLAGDGKAYIYFAPQADGGSPILQYKYSTDGGENYEDYIPGSIVSPLLITTGLTNEITYTVRLKAVNSVGESAESTSLTVTPTNTSPVATATLWLDPTDASTYTRSGSTISAAKLKTGADTVNGTIVGSGITYDSASAGGVFDFNGGGGAVINFPAYDFGSTITVTAWINPRVKHSINGLIANGTAWGGGTSGQGFRFQWNWWVSPSTSSSRTIQSQLGALLTPSTSNLNDDHSPTDIIQYDVWQHVGYQLDTANNTIIFFYNGVPTLITTDGITPSPITMAGLPFVIGGLRGGSYTMNAKLGDLKVFNTLLDATQIKAEFDATKTRFGLP